MKLYEKIKNLPESLKAAFEKQTKRIVLPGFSHLPLYDVIVFFIQGSRKSSLIVRANAVSFTFLLAIFPAILFFFTLIPYFPIEDLDNTIMETLSRALPQDAYNTLEETISDMVSKHNEGLLSIGFLVSLYFSTNGMIGLIKAFNRTSHTIETRSTGKLILISLLLVFIVSFIIIISAALLISTNLALKYLVSQGLIQKQFTKILILSGKWIFTLIMTYFAISTLYYLAPASRKHFRFFSPGSTLATILTFIFILGFNYYIENFSQYNKFYGSLGTLIILMLWVNLSMIVLLIGFELNASIFGAKKRKHEELHEME